MISGTNLNVILRNPAPKDSKTIWKFRNDAIRAQCSSSFPHEVITLLTPDDEPKWHMVSCIDPNVYFLVIDNAAGEPVACGKLDIKAEMIKSIFTDPNYSGLGYAGKIICALKEKAKKSGLKKLSISSSQNAESFYQKHGFIYVRNTPYWSEQAGVWLECIDMSCIL